MGQVAFDRWVSAGQKLGVPAVVCGALIWLIHSLGGSLLDQQRDFFTVQIRTAQALSESTQQMALASERMAGLLTEIKAELSEARADRKRAIDTIDGIDRRLRNEKK